jgi:hypothetical protein
MALTGKIAFRQTLMGKIVLKVEEEVKAPWPWSLKSAVRKRWRDAKLLDLAEPEMRTLMNLRNGPPRVTHSSYAALAAIRKAQQDDAMPSDVAPRSHADFDGTDIRLPNGH